MMMMVEICLVQLDELGKKDDDDDDDEATPPAKSGN